MFSEGFSLIHLTWKFMKELPNFEGLKGKLQYVQRIFLSWLVFKLHIHKYIKLTNIYDKDPIWLDFITKKINCTHWSI